MKTWANGKNLLFFCNLWVFSLFAMDYEEYVPPLSPAYDFSDEIEPKSQANNDDVLDSGFSSIYGLRPVTFEQVERDAQVVGSIVLPEILEWARRSLPCISPYEETLQGQKIVPCVQEVPVFCGNMRPEGVIRLHDASVFALQLKNPVYLFPLQQLQYIMRFLYKEALQRGFSMCWQVPFNQPHMLDDLPILDSKIQFVGPSSKSKEILASSVRLLREQEPEEIVGLYDWFVSKLKSLLPQHGYHLHYLQLMMHSFYKEAMQRGLSECWHQQQAGAFYAQKVAEKWCKESRKRAISSPMSRPAAKKRRSCQCKKEVEDEEWLPDVLKKHSEVKVH
jgi:hypothetical protein